MNETRQLLVVDDDPAIRDLVILRCGKRGAAPPAIIVPFIKTAAQPERAISVLAVCGMPTLLLASARRATGEV
jgi:hypothetical protein